MELTKQQMEVVIFALDREIDLERMSEEDIVDFAKKECGAVSYTHLTLPTKRIV